MKLWKCTICGYIHEGEEPPDVCPVCGAEKNKFELVDETSAPQTKAPSADISTTSRTQTETPFIWSDRFQWLTRLHGHPIAVHIPNGVLPLTVLLLLLSILFQSNVMAMAAKVNMIAVALSMPAVLISGVIDWHNRYKGRMSPVFKTKIICAGIVTVLTMVLAAWWFASPQIYLAGHPKLTIFVLLHLVDFIAAALAGFYGGKLVFPTP